MVAYTGKPRPKLRAEPMDQGHPANEAVKAPRRAWFGGEWLHTPVFEMSHLRPGNEVIGPAIVEDPTTTLVVPPGWRARIDEYRTIWMKEAR